jgi:streptogramin lyase
MPSFLRFDEVHSTFVRVQPELQQISVGTRDSVWGVSDAEDIFRFNATSGRFEQFRGKLALVQVGADNSVWGLSSNSDILRFNPGVGSTGSFEQIPGKLDQLSVGTVNSVWGMNKSEEIFHFDAGSGSFKQVPGPKLATLSVGADGSVWGITSFIKGDIFRLDPNTQSFVQVPGQLDKISVGAPPVAATLAHQPGAAYLSEAASVDVNVWGLIPAPDSHSPQQLVRFNTATQSFEQIPGPGRVADVSAGGDGRVWAAFDVPDTPGPEMEIFTFNGQRFNPLIPGSAGRLLPEISVIGAVDGSSLWVAQVGVP